MKLSDYLEMGSYLLRPYFVRLWSHIIDKKGPDKCNRKYLSVKN